MAIQKKHGKGRLDKWYKLAKQKGYRARAAFKLIQLNRKYGFLEKSKVLIDLCAAPGSWCQVAAEVMPSSSLIVGVDLAPIKPIPKVITFQSDITTEKCRATLRSHLKSWKADTVLHDGAPNVGTAWVQDSFNQAELTLQSLKLATEFLGEGGTFVTKVFRSRDFNSLMWVFNQLFTKVEATKPPSSRNVSAEIFVVCRGYKAPAKVDPKFLDPRTVFEELPDPTPNNEAKVYNPEKKKRKRDGYEEGDHLQFKEIPVTEFIENPDPIALLGGTNKFHFRQSGNGDVAMAAIDKLPETTPEVRACCEDLRVLGKRDFRLLLKWRLSVREKFGFASKKGEEKKEGPTEVAEVTDMDEEERIAHELEAMRERELAAKKRNKRKLNEQKQKEIVRMQLHMMAPTEIGLEQEGPMGEDSMFALKQVDKAGALDKVARGKMNIVIETGDEKAQRQAQAGIVVDEEEEDEEEAQDRLEEELDIMYEQYQERKSLANAKYRAKKAKEEHGDGEWAGITSDKEDEESDDDADDDVVMESDDEDSDEEVDSGSTTKKKLITSLEDESKKVNGLSKKAALFFDQDIFKDIGVDEDDDDEDDEDEDEEAGDMNGEQEEEEEEESVTNGTEEGDSEADSDWEEDVGNLEIQDQSDDENNGFEVVPKDKSGTWDDDDDEKRPDIDIITAEAMTLAQQLAMGETRKSQLIDDSYNRYSFRDKNGLPQWFLDDEEQHSKIQKPITAAGAAAIKEKLRALNARPIKKVKEAKDRKKYKAMQRLEKLRKKSALVAGDEAMSEKDKANSITKLMAKAAKKPKQQVKVVVARGANKGTKGRPKGVKGRYKIVDSRMKKEVRALKRLKKKIRS